MAINLQKGQRESVGSQLFKVGLGWDSNSSNTGTDFDLDCSIFILGENKKVLSDRHLVYYNNLTSPDNAVKHLGDNRTGVGAGDDECIEINLGQIEASAAEICFVVTIYEAEQRRQNFGQVRNSYVRIFDGSGTTIMKYELDEDFSVETAVEFGRLYKRNNEWKFEAIGTGQKSGLGYYYEKYR